MDNTFNLPKVRFFGNPKKSTGYGNATVSFARCFSNSNIDTKFIFPGAKYNSFKSELNSYSGDTDIDFYIHCPPYDKHRSNKYKIGYFYWEADKLPNGWGRSLNVLNEVWSPCKLVTNACIKSGYRGIIREIPTPSFYKLNSFPNKLKIPATLDNFVLGKDTFIFYSIFQWNYRKGYDKLVKAYYSEFDEFDNCILVIKTNPMGNEVGCRKKMYNFIKSTKDSIKKKISQKFFYQAQ